MRWVCELPPSMSVCCVVSGSAAVRFSQNETADSSIHQCTCMHTADHTVYVYVSRYVSRYVYNTRGRTNSPITDHTEGRYRNTVPQQRRILSKRRSHVGMLLQCMCISQWSSRARYSPSVPQQRRIFCPNHGPNEGPPCENQM